uniref:SGNH hydrolase-type esterase domain-containing protein n=1 Tax=Oncorhynchus tshawytscha TaxID=74940 RepID=A0AAZ3RZ35_ONCTS
MLTYSDPDARQVITNIKQQGGNISPFTHVHLSGPPSAGSQTMPPALPDCSPPNFSDYGSPSQRRPSFEAPLSLRHTLLLGNGALRCTTHLEIHQLPLPRLPIIGSSIVRDVVVDGTKTFCFPGARVRDITREHTVILDQNPELHMMIVHAGTNDIKLRQWAELRRVFKYRLLATGKHIVFSGPIPTHGHGVDHVYWLFCSEKVFNLFDNFNLFWEQLQFLKRDGLHPNRKGAWLLSANIEKVLRK